MSSEVALRATRAQSLPAKVEYAKLLADSGLLPAAYRMRPANVLYAVEYGDMLGLPPMAAITGIHIIEGKPSASAGLISALVRRAGHKLRVGYDAEKRTGWAEIVRSDDPDYTFRSEWDLNRAVTAELCTIKDGQPFALDSKGKSLPWRKFFPSMTKARAITEVARDACEEALYGLHYTPEELGAELTADGEVAEADVVDAEIVPDETAVETDQEWLASALERAANFTEWDPDGLKVWHETGEKLRAGECSKADADNIAAVIKAHKAELDTAADTAPVEGTVVPPLEPDDPWSAKVDELATAEDVAAAEDEVREAVKAGSMDLTHGNRVLSAIHVKAGMLPDTAAAA